MSDHRLYVPILKGKRGEFEALSELSASARAQTTPAIEIIPVNDETKTETAGTSLVSQLKKAGAGERRMFVDFTWVATSPQLVQALLNSCREAHLQVVPVVSPEHGEALHDVLREAIDIDRRGACIRLRNDSLATVELTSTIGLMLARFNLQPADVDLVLDFQEVTRRNQARDTNAAVDVINAVPTPALWRTFTLAASAFPETLSAITRNTSASIPRTEWHIWCELNRRQAELHRVPTFGDYGIQHYGLPTFDPTKMGLSASVRYTDDENYVVWKGSSLKKNGHQQFNAIAKIMVEHSAFRPNLSAGDRYVQRCALGGPSGNHSKWRAVSTSHHVEVVTRQLANLPPGLSAVA